MKLAMLAAAAAFAASICAGPATAQVQPYIGQLMLTAGNYCPKGWLPATGELLPIAQYSPLFQVLGTTYGGDGRTNFGLPKLASPKAANAQAGAITWCIAIYGVYPSRS